MDMNTIPSLGDVRRSVTYHPTVWGDHFLAYANSTEISGEEEVEKMKEEVRQLLASTSDDSIHKLNLVDTIQRLGLAYHFDKEIDMFLKYVHEQDIDNIEDDNLYVVSLRFRLLREQGYNASPEVFNKFKDDQGKFNESLVANVEGILSLYEAAQYAVNGEDILDDALQFSTSHLKSLQLSLLNNTSIATQVKEALKTPIHKSLNRLYAKRFINVYEKDETHNKLLLHFAKLDFNLVLKMHQKELVQITRWWKELDMCNKLSFVRDRMAECYFWILGVYFEPQFQFGRVILTKVLVIATIIDDIYDVHGTMDELQLFTDAIQRWNLSAVDQLPPYMKITYEALLNVYLEMEEFLRPHNNQHWTDYAIQEMKKLIRAYHQEAKWMYKGHIPSLEEYMKVGIVSAAYMMASTTSLLGMEILESDLKWVTREPSIVLASSLIARLMDDKVGYGFEKKYTLVDCYMNDKRLTKEEAFEEIDKHLSRVWKDMNEEWLNPAIVSSKTILRPIINLARVIYFIYLDGDGYTNSKTQMKEAIELVLAQPFPI